MQYMGSGRAGKRKCSQPRAEKSQKSKEMSYRGSTDLMYSLRRQEQAQQCLPLWLFQRPPHAPAHLMCGEDSTAQPLQVFLC